MTINVNIDQGLEARLLALARSTGRSIEDLIHHIIEQEAMRSPANGYPSGMSGPERAKAFRTWAKSFPTDLPALSLESVSRERIYERD